MVGSSGIMVHDVDRHLVAGGIYLNRVHKELEKIPRDKVDESRVAALEELAETISRMVNLLEEVRTGRKQRARRPRTLADVADLDTYRKEFLEGDQA